METRRDRWTAAMRDLRRAGLKARTNVQQCCRGCVTPEQLNYDESRDEALLWTYGSQGRETYADLAEGVYVNHDRVTQRLYLTVIRPVLEAHGLLVRWDGRDWSCLVVVDAPQADAAWWAAAAEDERRLTAGMLEELDELWSSVLETRDMEEVVTGWPG